MKWNNWSPGGSLNESRAMGTVLPLKPVFPVEAFDVFLTEEHLECFESQNRRRFFSSGPDIGFKGISYDPQWAGTLTSGNFLLVFFFGGGGGGGAVDRVGV